MITPRTPPGQASDDDDPTGVRALLSSLPDPGPMPPELVERITASLAAEQQQVASPSLGDDLTARRETFPARRRATRLRTVVAVGGAAASVAALAVIGLILVDDGRPTVPTVAQFPTSSTGLEPAEHGAAEEPRHADGQDAAAAGPYQVHIQRSDTAYTSEDFLQQVARLKSPAGEPVAPMAVEELGVVATPSGLAQCLDGLGPQVQADPDQVRADLATFDGRPAVIVLITTNGKSQAWAIGRDCTSGPVPVMQGPTDLL